MAVNCGSGVLYVSGAGKGEANGQTRASPLRKAGPHGLVRPRTGRLFNCAEFFLRPFCNTRARAEARCVADSSDSLPGEASHDALYIGFEETYLLGMSN